MDKWVPRIRKLLTNERIMEYDRHEIRKKQLREKTRLIADHNSLGKHTVKLNISVDNTCRYKEAVENSYQFSYECPALSNEILLEIFSFRIYSKFRKLILDFMDQTKWKGYIFVAGEGMEVSTGIYNGSHRII